jgi:8-oxo-dGTP pyrophosphatase MutT (NUDIX family)
VDTVPQAGGIAFRREGDSVAVLLVRAKRVPDVWILPKGHIEAGESAAEAALRETEEEAGVTGELLGPIGKPLEFDNGREFVSVQYFLIRTVSESLSTDGRLKQWFPFDDAISAVRFGETRKLLQEARLRIERLT